MEEVVGRGLFRFEREMHARAVVLTGSEADAADLVQDTFERVLRSWHRLKPGTDIRGWLLRVMAGLHAGDRPRAGPHWMSFERLPRSTPAGALRSA
jgi:DNA-directed RNA polymerase specialized sigma24 family protein